MKRVIVFVLLALALPLLVPQHVEALSFTGLTIDVFCDHIHLSAHDSTFDRNNVVTPSTERYQLYAYDAASTVVYFEEFDIPFGTYSVGAEDKNYTATPVDGTITVVYKSVAGNGLDEEIPYTTTGTCGEASTATPTPTTSPTATPTFTATPGPSPTPTETLTPTPNYIIHSTLVFGGTPYDVAINMEVRPSDYVQIGFQVVVVGLLMMLVFLTVRRGRT